MQKHRKWKSSFRIVKYDVSWGSPCSKKGATLWKNTFLLFIIFYQNFLKKRWKIEQKTCKIALRTKIDKHRRLERPFFSKKSIFGWFLGSLWVPGSLPGRPGSLPESFIFFMIFQLRLKMGPEGFREARGSPQAPPGDHFGSILNGFCISKNIQIMPQNVKETSQKLFKNLERNMTLIRATEEPLIDR